jgi:hypothetical protein
MEWPRLAPLLAAGAGVALTGTAGRELLEAMPRVADSLEPDVVRELDARIPRGAQVFTCGWQLTGALLLHLPGRRYMVALDPVLFRQRSPELYARWWELVHAPPPRPAREVAETFGASWVLCETRPSQLPFIRALMADPGARLVLPGRVWAGFEIARPGVRRQAVELPTPLPLDGGGRDRARG